MKKILIAVLIVLLIVLAYFTIFEGLMLGTLEILSVEQMIDKNDSLTQKISEAKSLLEKDYPAKKEDLSTEVSNLLKKKEEYFDLAKISTEGEISKANTEETYLIEYLWTRVGTHAKTNGVLLKMVFSSAGTGEQEMHNINFTVKGSYVDIIEFMYTIEDDSELNFKLENFKMVPNGESLTATFVVNNIRIKNETAAVYNASETTTEETEVNN